MKIITTNNCNLIFKLGTYDNNETYKDIWSATYAKDNFEFDFEFNEVIFKHQNSELDWEAITFVVNKVESEIISLNSKSVNLCKALYQEIFGKIDIEKFPFELSGIQIESIR